MFLVVRRRKPLNYLVCKTLCRRLLRRFGSEVFSKYVILVSILLCLGRLPDDDDTLESLDQSTLSSNEVMGESSFGTLLTAAGNLPLRQLHYRTHVLGFAIRTTIVQTHFNPFDECIEATYIRLH